MEAIIKRVADEARTDGKDDQRVRQV